MEWEDIVEWNEFWVQIEEEEGTKKDKEWVRGRRNKDQREEEEGILSFWIQIENYVFFKLVPMLNFVFGFSPYTNPSHQLVPTHEVPHIAPLASSSFFFHEIERQGLDPKRLINTWFVSQQKNLQGLK